MLELYKTHSCWVTTGSSSDMLHTQTQSTQSGFQFTKAVRS